MNSSFDQFRNEARKDRRASSDRRVEPTGPWAALAWRPGRRVENRRATDRRRTYFVDRFSPALWIGVLALVAGSLIDAVFTLHSLDRGGREINPLMGGLLRHGAAAFIAGKYLLTVLGLPLLLIFKNHRLFGGRVLVGQLIPACVALYAMLLAYQILLIEHRVGW